MANQWEWCATGWAKHAAGVLIGVIAGLTLVPSGASEAAAPDDTGTSSAKHAICKMTPGPKHAVTRVSNGETVVLDDNSTVRLQAVFAPLAPLTTAIRQNATHEAHPAERRGLSKTDLPASKAQPPAIWPPERDATRALEHLTLGKSVQLFFSDRRFRRDRYGAHLAQLFVLDDDERIWVQRYLVENGLARVDPARTPPACTARLMAAERQARKQRRGLWRHAPYAVRKASKPRQLLRYVHTFQIVQGRIRSVGDRRGRIYLNFGKRWKTDFTATISKRDRKRMERAGVNFKRLRGKRVQIRGWVEDWNGPAIRIRRAGQIQEMTPLFRKQRKRPRPRRSRPEERPEQMPRPSRSDRPPQLDVRLAPRPVQPTPGVRTIRPQPVSHLPDRGPDV